MYTITKTPAGFVVKRYIDLKPVATCKTELQAKLFVNALRRENIVNPFDTDGTPLYVPGGSCGMKVAL